MSKVTTVSLAALTSIKSATGRIATEDVQVEGTEKPQKRTYGILTLDTDDGKLELRLDQFDGIYKGFVNVWPGISGVKQQVIEANRAETKATRDAIKAEKDAATKAEKDKAKADREAAAAKAKKDKEDAAKKAKDEKAAADAKAKKDKEAADAKKLKAASDAKAKKDTAAK